MARGKRGRGAASGARTHGASSDPWSDEKGADREVPGIGTGFARFDRHGDRVRGVIVNIFPTEHPEFGKGKAAAIQLTEVPTAKVETRDEDGKVSTVAARIGETINVGIKAADLKRKIDEELIGEEVGIAYVDDLEVRNGTMRVYRVKVFET